MGDLAIVVGLTWLAGLAMPAGALLGTIDTLRPNWLGNELRHAIIAFGGGALLSAIALVLIPDGVAVLPIPQVALWFALGGIAFFGLDLLLAKINSPAGQLAAMLSDFIPEALAMGAAFAVGDESGPLLAALIALQNVPEGFNSFRELNASTSFSATRIVMAFLAMSLLGPVAGLTGYYALSGIPWVVDAIMLFAAGGILYLIFQDIAPQAKLQYHWGPPLGAVAGFLLGLIGKLLVG